MLGLDIGGTLAKVVFLGAPPAAGDRAAASPLRWQQAALHFRCFETAGGDLDALLACLREVLARHPELARVPVTGGGAHKFAPQIAAALDRPVVRVDEMRSTVLGLAHLIALDPPQEVYTYDLSTAARQLAAAPTYPLLLVNVGSGVSILKIDAPDRYQRVSGTCIGGGTVLGLCKLAIGVKDFHEVITLSRQGHSENLDLTVRDLQGDTAGSSFLPPDLLASSFGKLHNNDITIRKCDFAHSAVRMVSYNLGYLAYLLASIHDCSKVLFGGKYICDHDDTMKAMTEGLLFPQLKNSKSSLSFEDVLKKFQRSGKPSIQPYFLKHDGFLGALGALASSV